MNPLDEYPLQRDPVPVAGHRRNRWALVAAVLVVSLVVGIAAYYLWRGPAPVATGTTPAESDTGAPVARAPLGPDVTTGPLPPLDESDPLVRELLGRLSSHPQVAAWLATDDLIRHVVVSVDNVATGATPARHVQVLAPAGRFEVETGADRITVAERSFERYDALADAVASLDPRGLAELYARLKPRLQEAYVELGHPGRDIDAAVEQALVHLLRTPVPRSPVVVEPGIVSFAFGEQELEGLTAAQKQLLRMGPRNVRTIQAALRALAQELGIPPERLPAPRG
jgi:hypothetical protein